MDIAELHDVMADLARSRPVFHSEADFLHALAWQIHLRDPGSVVRLEQRIQPSLYVDLVLNHGGTRTAFELTYLTRAVTTTNAGEAFNLRHDGAQEQGRYDVVGDLARIEHLVNGHHAAVGFVVVLTNDPSYWETPASAAPSIDDAFRIHEGNRLSGTRAWAANAALVAIHNRELAHHLHAEYAAGWRDYADVGDGDARGHFRYLAIEVLPKPRA
jgi:hypothetical protein